MIHGVLPILLVFIITKKEKELLETTISKYVGEIYEGTKTNTRLKIAYTLMFIVRRGLYLSLGMLILNPNYGGI